MIDKQEEFHYEGWYKNQFTFKSKDGVRTLSFVPYYRAGIGKSVTIEYVIQQGCEYIFLDGEEIEGSA